MTTPFSFLYSLPLLSRITGELDEALRGGCIRKIYQEGGSVTLDIHVRGGTHILWLSIRPPRLHLSSSRPIGHPPRPPAFCQALRKYLVNARVVEISCHPILPVVTMAARSRGEGEGGRIVALVAELTGQFSNLLLLDAPPSPEASPRILHLLRTFTSANRRVAIHEDYRLPHLSPGLRRRIEGGLGLDDLDLSAGGTSFPCNEAVARFVEERLQETAERDARRRVVRLLRQAREKLDRQRAQIARAKEAVADAERKRRIGDLILIHAASLERGRTRIELPDLFDPEERPIEIDLEPSLTPAENAERYFRAWKKARKIAAGLPERERALRMRKERLEALEGEVAVAPLARLEAIERELAPSPSPSSPPLPPEAGRRFRTFRYGAWTILIGKDGEENDRLVTRIGRPNDFWFHARATSGSHVLIRGPKGDPPHEILRRAAAAAAWYSKARNDTKVEVVYTRVKHLHKPKGSPPGLVRLRQFKSMIVAPCLPRVPQGEDARSP